MNVIEIFAVIFTLLSIVLTIKENVLCWPIGIIGIILYSIIFYQHNLLASFGLQGVFLVQSIIGWVNWMKPKKLLSVTRIDKSSLPIYIGSTIGIYLLIFLITNTYVNLTYLDSAVATISIMATFLLIKKKVESWILWILNNITLLILFYMSGLFLLSITSMIFLGLAVMGLNEWVKVYKHEKI